MFYKTNIEFLKTKVESGMLILFLAIGRVEVIHMYRIALGMLIILLESDASDIYSMYVYAYYMGAAFMTYRGFVGMAAGAEERKLIIRSKETVFY